jgi:hypothetical protein
VRLVVHCLPITSINGQTRPLLNRLTPIPRTNLRSRPVANIERQRLRPLAALASHVSEASMRKDFHISPTLNAGRQARGWARRATDTVRAKASFVTSLMNA